MEEHTVHQFEEGKEFPQGALFKEPNTFQ